MIEVGEDRSLFQPLNQTGDVSPEVRGCHRGPAATLNIHNPLPNMVYYWCRHPRLDRGAQLQRLINEGYEVVPPESPEHKGKVTNLNYAQFGLDNYQVHGDVVMLRITEDAYRERQELKESLNKASMGGETQTYESRGLSLEERYGSRSDGPIYYRGPGHGIHQ